MPPTFAPSEWPRFSLSSREGFGRLLSRVAWPILLCALALSIYASLELRGLYADGAHHLMLVVESGGFALIETARATVHVLEQFPAVLAIRLGSLDSEAVVVLYGLTIHTVPLILVALCYPVLPRDLKGLFAFPLLHYLAGSTAAGFAPVTEGTIAAAYFWLLFCLILFRTDSLAARLLTAAAAIPAIFAHEAMVFLAPVLALAAAWRARRESSLPGKALLWLLVAWFAVVVAVQIGFAAEPRDPENKRAFIQQMKTFQWLVGSGGLNVPAALGILASLAAAAVALCSLTPPSRRRPWERMSWALVAAFGLLSAVVVIATAVGLLPLVPRLQFAARNHSALLSFPLAVLAFVSVLWPPLCALWARRQNVAILAALAVGALGWHVVGVHHWSDYVRTFRSVLSGHQGLVAWEPLLESLPTHQREAMLNMGWWWTQPTMSFWLSPGGRVSTVIANPANVGWQPFDPADPGTLPKSELFDTSAYRQALAGCDEMADETSACP